MTEKLKGKNFPILRFKADNGNDFPDWQLKKMEEIAPLQRGFDLPVQNIIDGNIPIVYSNGILKYHNEYKCKAPAIITGRSGTIGKFTYIENGNYWPHNTSLWVTNFFENYPKFIYYLYQTINIESFSTGSGVPTLNRNNVHSRICSVPAFEEQNKIADFLFDIDSRIHTQRKIIEGLITVKNSVINKIFDGKLKFTSEDYNSSDLELKKLSEFLSIPPKIKPDEIDKEKLLTVKLHLKGVHKNEKSETLSIGATNYFVRKKGQFIYGKQNLFNGAFAIIPDCYDGFLSSADVPTLEINSEKLNGKYLFYLFSRESFYKKLEDISTGSGSKRIHESDLLKVKILVPSLVKQNKIVEFLSSFDEKIIIEKDLLINYENQKKYLLANLFI